MKLLIAVESCHAHRDRHQIQRDTWIKDLGNCFDYKFFLGRRYAGAEVLRMTADDEIELDVDDSYDALSKKTRAIMFWAFEHGYDFVHKTDTDTLISVPNLYLSPFDEHDYYGGDNADDMPPSLKDLFPWSKIGFASGGAGYWLSRRAMEFVAHGPDGVNSAAEDVFVAGILKRHGIAPCFDRTYRWRPEANLDGSMSTYHLSSALRKRYDVSDMRMGYDKIKLDIERKKEYMWTKHWKEQK